MGGAVGIVGFEAGNLEAGWQGFRNEWHPWEIVHALFAALIACRIKTGEYPDCSTLKGMRRYQAWGSLHDAVVFVLPVVLVTYLIVLPMFANNVKEQVDYALHLGTVALVAAAVGFFVPTWYRANLHRKTAEAECEPPSDRPDSPPKLPPPPEDMRDAA